MTTKKRETTPEPAGDFSNPAFAEADQHLYDKADDQTIPAEEAEEKAKEKGEAAEAAAKDEAKAAASDNKAVNEETQRNAAQHKAAHPEDDKK